MVTPVFFNNYVADGVFGPGTILCRIMYNRKSHKKAPLSRILACQVTPYIKLYFFGYGGGMILLYDD
jgi:hypothetical protein